MVRIIESEIRLMEEKIGTILKIFEENGFKCIKNLSIYSYELHKNDEKVGTLMYFIGITIWGSAEVFLPVAEKLEENGFEVTIKY